MSIHACCNPKCGNVFSDEYESVRVHVKIFGTFVIFCSKECYEDFDSDKQNYLTT